MTNRFKLFTASPQHLGSESRRDLHDQIRARPQHPKTHPFARPLWLDLRKVAQKKMN